MNARVHIFQSQNERDETLQREAIARFNRCVVPHPLLLYPVSVDIIPDLAALCIAKDRPDIASDLLRAHNLPEAR